MKAHNELVDWTLLNFSENSDKAAMLCSGLKMLVDTEAMSLISPNIRKLQNNLQQIVHGLTVIILQLK